MEDNPFHPEDNQGDIIAGGDEFRAYQGQEAGFEITEDAPIDPPMRNGVNGVTGGMSFQAISEGGKRDHTAERAEDTTTLKWMKSE